ncbi:hypothetical protein SLS62_010032 [Diatrype stigma]|uniref:ABC transporter domain-containing protein n=1 Tax=Diatrype stigma TaxID=117547 RepID=A0AAN9YJ22_9PEZI
MSLPLVWRQTWALTRKNFLIAVVRSWRSILIRSLILPIALLVLLLEIQNFSKDKNKYGFGSPEAVLDLADTVHEKKLVFVRAPDLGPDFDPVFKKIVEPLGPNTFLELDNAGSIQRTCPVDYHGTSPCHAVVIFNDSPQSGRPGAHWNYTIRTDPSQVERPFNVFSTDGPLNHLYLPLQVAIENAITNSTTVPDVLKFSYQGTQEQADESSRQLFVALALYILSFVFFMTMMPVSHHVASMIASERESGMSHLIDAMGGGVATPRVLSYIGTFYVLYLPLWIILGCLFQNLLLSSLSPAVTIFWQILTGWAVTSSSVFGAAFFKRSQLAAILVSLFCFLLAVLAAYQENLMVPPPLAQIVVLSFLFPSMNHVFFFSYMAKSELVGIPFNMDSPIPADALDTGISGEGMGENWVSQAPPYFLIIILAIQIVGYLLLAILVEHLMHGNNRRNRDFAAVPGAEHVAVHTSALTKYYYPGFFKRWFCCSRKPTVKAVDGLDLTSQKNQILCLLGPNGSGKTTTLDMLAGFQTPTSGSIHIDTLPSKLGICPQRNVLFNNLTVYEHLVIWNCLKGNLEDAASLERLIERCDLTLKRNSYAKHLSGGTKRKLQLACMLVGGSSVCLLDEVTSGVDPLSRRVIWNAILAERSHRTIILTTHFLDESEVLSDHIVILSLGKTKCQGTPAELKNEYGGGYRVHIPKTEDISKIPYPVADKKSRYVCTTPDSASAARLLATLGNSDDSELFITGPTIEDVFLKVSEDPHMIAAEKLEAVSTPETRPSQQMVSTAAPTEVSIFLRQVRALFIKRFIILRSTWWAYFFALAIPIVASPFLGDFLKDYETPNCDDLIADEPYNHVFSPYTYGLVIGPQAANESLVDIINDSDPSYSGGNYDSPTVENSRDSLLSFIQENPRNATSGGLWLGNDSTSLVAVPVDSQAPYIAMSLVNVMSQAQSGMNITGSSSNLMSYSQADAGNSSIWVTIFCLLHALYPAFFALYPTYERRSQVRALQYSNGIRALPLLLAYMMFDSVFVLIVSIICTALVASQAPWFGIGHIFLVQALYGMAAILIVYLVSRMTRSQPAAFASSVLAMAIMYILSMVATTVNQSVKGGDLKSQDGLTFGLGLIFPTQNLLTGMSMGLNSFIIRCRGTEMITNPASIYAFGGPIMLLILQIIGLFCLLLWIEGSNFSWLSRKPKVIARDNEKAAPSGRPDVDAETARVESSKTDLLRMVHVTKQFGTNKAVDDVSLGLRPGEILALLGPNGAGKTTAINMIRGDLTPTDGNIYLEGIDVHTNKRLAQQNLGVCPQFDALDMLTVKEQLIFYARCKGVQDIQGDVEYVMGKVGITAHASKQAGKLSGGNKRKLSLGIALLGNPPVLLLDEPSSAMDAASKRVLWRTLEAVAPGRSVLLTTHSMEEADALAGRAAIVARRLLAVGTTQELRRAHSNEYHVHLILASAPLSPPEEMDRVAGWVRAAFPDVLFEGRHLGGQVRFIVPADSQVPAAATPQGKQQQQQSSVRYLIETLESHKEQLGIDCYSIGAATMERVFLSVVKESDAVEDEGDEKKKRWWRS